jgi:hypothetical protein
VSGSEVTVTFGPDKTLSLSVNGTLLAKGTWWLDGDNYCHDLGADFGGSECFQVIQNGSRILLFDLDGYAVLQLEVVQRAGPSASIRHRIVDLLGQLIPQWLEQYHYLFTERAAGGLYTTATDLARFVAAEMPGPNGESAGRTVLSADTLALMFTPVVRLEGQEA